MILPAPVVLSVVRTVWREGRPVPELSLWNRSQPGVVNPPAHAPWGTRSVPLKLPLLWAPPSKQQGISQQGTSQDLPVGQRVSLAFWETSLFPSGAGLDEGLTHQSRATPSSGLAAPCLTPRKGPRGGRVTAPHAPMTHISSSWSPSPALTQPFPSISSWAPSGRAAGVVTVRHEATRPLEERWTGATPIVFLSPTARLVGGWQLLQGPCGRVLRTSLAWRASAPGHRPGKGFLDGSPQP